MAKQDDWTRLTVRMPPELYDRLQALIAAGPNSMNAEIVARLEQSFSSTQYVSQEDALAYGYGVLAGALDVLSVAIRERHVNIESFVDSLNQSAKDRMKTRGKDQIRIREMLKIAFERQD